MELNKKALALADIIAGAGCINGGGALYFLYATGEADTFCLLLSCISILMVAIAIYARTFLSTIPVSPRSTALHTTALLVASFEAGLMAAFHSYWPLMLYCIFIALGWGLNARTKAVRKQ